MNRFLFAFCFALSLLTTSKVGAQTIFPTNREVYNFSVGDTFIYSYFQYDGSCPLQYAYTCSHDYLVVVTGKSFSTDSNTVFYTYQTGGYSTSPPFALNPSYTDLDSAVLLPPYPDYTTNEIDSAYIDTTHYCTPRLKAFKQNRYGLSDFFNTTYVSGLGKTGDSYAHDQGSSPAGDFSLDLVYYHKAALVCGSYDSTKLISAINQIMPEPDIKLYPNPADDILHISGVSGVEYDILDATGRICQTGHLQKEVGINKLLAGIYFLRFVANSRPQFMKFTKQ